MSDRPINAEALQVVALVASTGGFTAVSQVLDGLPPDFDGAVIVLIHQRPDRPSHLAQLLQRRSALPVAVAQDTAPLRRGTAIVAPPGCHVLITPGPSTALIMSGEIPPNRPSADLLLTTLATACGSNATAVVLSGHGHDAATGATAIHHFGGTVLASSEASSEVFSMPKATIARDNAIDHVVELDQIPSLLTSIVTAPRLARRTEDDNDAPSPDATAPKSGFHEG